MGCCHQGLGFIQLMRNSFHFISLLSSSNLPIFMVFILLKLTSIDVSLGNFQVHIPYNIYIYIPTYTLYFFTHDQILNAFREDLLRDFFVSLDVEKRRERLFRHVISRVGKTVEREVSLLDLPMPKHLSVVEICLSRLL